MLTASKQCMRYLLFVTNFIFVLTGIALIILGFIIRSADVRTYSSVLEEEYLEAPNVIIFLGFVVFLVSFFGCCGSINENRLMLITFSVLMGAIFIAEITIGVTGYTMKAEVTEAITDKLTTKMANYNKTVEATKFWDQLQEGLSCCGTKNYTEWNTILHKLPTSCCNSTVHTTTCDDKSVNLYKTPCLEALGNIVKENASLIGLTGLCIGVIQLLGMIISCSLAYFNRNDYESV